MQNSDLEGRNFILAPNTHVSFLCIHFQLFHFEEAFNIMHND